MHSNLKKKVTNNNINNTNGCYKNLSLDYMNLNKGSSLNSNSSSFSSTNSTATNSIVLTPINMSVNNISNNNTNTNSNQSYRLNGNNGHSLNDSFMQIDSYNLADNNTTSLSKLIAKTQLKPNFKLNFSSLKVGPRVRQNSISKFTRIE